MKINCNDFYMEKVTTDKNKQDEFAEPKD